MYATLKCEANDSHKVVFPEDSGPVTAIRIIELVFYKPFATPQIQTRLKR